TSFKFSADTGRLLENLVYVELRRLGSRVFYHKGKHECDFIVQEKDRIVSAIQVTEKLVLENEKRELGGLEEAMVAHSLKEGFIITMDQSEERVIGTMQVHVMPAWLWLIKMEHH
nr:ATP-binding protein [Candidatus Sigynarchaeota archaeon]